MTTLTKGQHRLVWKQGDWKTTLAAVGLNSKLYTSDEAGDLYWLDPSNERYDKLTATGGWKSRCLVTSYQRLFSLEESGTFFSIDADDGTYAKIGTDGQWATTRACAAIKGKLYTCDQNGKLYALDPWTSEYKQIGDSAWASDYLFEAGDYLATLEESGTIYRLNPKDATWEPVGEKGMWAGAKAASGKSGYVWIVDKDGAIWMASVWGSAPERIGTSNWDTRLLVMGDYYLYSLEQDGSLYEIAVYG